MKGESDVPGMVIASQVGSEAVLHEVHHVDFGLAGEPIDVGPEFIDYLLSEQPPVYPGDPLCEERWVDPTKLYDRSPNKPRHNRPVCVSLAPLPVRLKEKGTAMICRTDLYSFVVEDLDGRSLFGLSFGLDGLPSSNGMEKAPQHEPWEGETSENPERTPIQTATQTRTPPPARRKGRAT